ncbi:alpha-2-HS-glycoprotein-like [Syngnathoides biaculeatus]|uniref:alpha-2-HS-glycoprotein-like n=1 Tax=Syngnathoides biaculeatus TaxID=300417 RepID=UPI002ADDAFFF|nr:alpha-2-HS-glycoprotein-like [Syngnathoides biaculeatus]
MPTQLLAVLLLCAAAAPGLRGAPSSPAVTCDGGGEAAAASLAVRHINEHHEHGFKFKLDEMQSSKIEHVPGGCHFDVNVKLMQTDCHVTNPKPADQCDFMMQSERGAVATCNSKLDVKGGVATVTSHQCATRPELSNSEMVATCPDCPALLPLDDETGVKAVEEAVKKFNRESNHQNYFALMEISLLTSGYIPSVGTNTWLKFALVETVCPKNSRILQQACTPRCPDRAHHAFCESSYTHSTGELGAVTCEVYLPKNTEPLEPGAQEPACSAGFHGSAEASACTARLGAAEPSIHPICPFPLAVQLPQVPQLRQV